MKKYLALFLGILIFTCSFSQTSFEGVVKYKTDIKGQNTVMEGMMPDSFIFLFKNKDVRMILLGGIVSAMMGDIISKGDSNVSFMLDNTNKIAYRYDPFKYEKSPITDIEETGKTQKILNKNCSLYKISYATKDGYVVTNLWVTNEFHMSIPGNNPLGKNFVFSGVSGFPLLIESKIEYQATKFDIIIKAVRVIERPINAEEFEIPQNFKIVPLIAPSDLGY